MKAIGPIVLGLLVIVFSILIFGLWFGSQLASDETKIDYARLGRNHNSLNFNDEQIKEIKANYTVLDSLFRLVSERLKIPISRTGFVAYDTVFYYRNCSDSHGTYISVSECNFEKYFDESTIAQGNVAIKSLIRLGFSGFQYVSAFNKFTLLVNTEFVDSRDYRIVLVQDDLDTAVVSKTYLELIEFKKGLALFRQN
jgi:hypothetical protein